jgi:hypothetical protein
MYPQKGSSVANLKVKKQTAKRRLTLAESSLRVFLHFLAVLVVSIPVLSPSLLQLELALSLLS